MNTKHTRFVALAVMSALFLFNVAPLVAKADNPTPTLTSISPSQVGVGSAGFTLTVNGSNFVLDSVVNVNGTPRTTSFISSTQLTASVLASDVDTGGTVNITVVSPAPGGGTSGVRLLTVSNAAPAITSLAPSAIMAGSGAFTVTVNGNNFLPTSVVRFNGEARSTTYVSPTKLTAAILASDLTSSGNFNITVANPASAGGTSASQTFVVGSAANLIPSILNISPSVVMVGSGSFTLTVTGNNFNTSSKVNFNGIAKTTTFVSGSQLTATIPASDLAVTGTYTISVTNPAPGGGTSNISFFTVSPTSVTPGFPDTGFGPIGQNWQVSTVLAAMSAAFLGMAFIAFKKAKHAPLKK